MPTLVKNEQKVRDYLKERIVTRYGTLAAYARKKEVAPSYVANVIRGVKPIPAWMLQGFNVKHNVEVSWELPR